LVDLPQAEWNMDGLRVKILDLHDAPPG
jgi:hypothetical protein